MPRRLIEEIRYINFDLLKYALLLLQSMTEVYTENKAHIQTRNSLVDGYQKVLPSVQRGLALQPDVLNKVKTAQTNRHIGK